MISSINPLMAALCISWGIEGVEGCSLEGGNIGEFWDGVAVVVVTTRAIACVDFALFFHI